MKRLKVILVGVALLVMLVAISAPPAMAAIQRCSSGDIEIEGSGGDISIESNNRGGCKHGKKHHKHSKRHHHHR